MNVLKPCKSNFFQSIISLSNHTNFQKRANAQINNNNNNGASCKTRRKVQLRASSSGGGERKSNEKRSFLSLEEAGIVEMSGLLPHEKFLCRLTISSLNLLRVISEQEGCSIEQLNAGRVCDWFLKDKLKTEQNLDTAVLQWDDPNFPL